MYVVSACLNSPRVSIMTTGYRPSTHGVIMYTRSHQGSLVASSCSNKLHSSICESLQTKGVAYFCSKLLESIFGHVRRTCLETTAAGLSLYWGTGQRWKRREGTCSSGVKTILFNSLVMPRLSCYRCFRCSCF